MPRNPLEFQQSLIYCYDKVQPDGRTEFALDISQVLAMPATENVHEIEGKSNSRNIKSALRAPHARARRSRNPYFDEVRAEYQTRRNVLVDGLMAIPGVRCTRPAGAFYLMAELPVDSSEDFCRWMLTEFQHDKRTVMMAPGQGFYITPGAGEREVRLAYVLNCDDLRAALDVLGRGLDAYPGRA